MWKPMLSHTPVNRAGSTSLRKSGRQTSHHSEQITRKMRLSYLPTSEIFYPRNAKLKEFFAGSLLIPRAVCIVCIPPKSLSDEYWNAPQNPSICLWGCSKTLSESLKFGGFSRIIISSTGTCLTSLQMERSKGSAFLLKPSPRVSTGHFHR